MTVVDSKMLEHTSPRRTGKDYSMHLDDELELPHRALCVLIIQSQDFKTVSSEPGNLICNAVDLGIVLCALECGLVLLNGVNPLPST